MAIYHFSVQIFQRSAGRSAFAGAMYRAGEKGTCIYDGQDYDYTGKDWVEHTEILLPEHIERTHPEFFDRQELWNTIEWNEKSPKAQLAREIELSLPVELTFDQQRELIRDFVQKDFVNQGMIADICIHNPPVRDDLGRPIDETGQPTRDINKMQFRNPHAHVMLSMRPMDKNGKWESKKQKEYLCCRNGETKGFTASEFSIAREAGWEKQFRYQFGNNKVWLTPSQAENIGLTADDRISLHARASKSGRPNEITAYWNSKDRVREWRQAWENAVNQKFQSLGIDQRVDCRSNADRGLEELATEHLGKEAANIERRADRLHRSGCPETKVERSTAGDINRDIQKYNEAIETEKKTEKAVDTQIKNTAGKLEYHRGRMIKSTYAENITAKAINTAQRAVNEKTDTLQTTMDMFNTVTAANEKALAVIESLTKLLESCSRFQLSRKKELQQQIADERQGIADRNAYLKSVIHQNGISGPVDIEIRKSEKELLEDELSELQHRERMSVSESKSALHAYSEEMRHVPDRYRKRVDDARSEMRPYAEKTLQREITGSETANPVQLQEATKQVDQSLSSSGKTELHKLPDRVNPKGRGR